jgi:carboxypeptidase C (cathepsin A)
MHRALTLIAFILVILWVRGVRAQPAEPPKAQAKGEAAAAKAAPTKETAPEKPKTKSSTDEEPVVTHHRISVDGKELKYTATAGLMPIKDAKGETEAHIFYIAYTLDEPTSGASRPLMFSFNGGPGSASVWLHLGTLGPRRVTMRPGSTAPTLSSSTR